MALPASFVAAELTKSIAFASLLPFASIVAAFAKTTPASEGSVAVFTSSAFVVVFITSALRTSVIVIVGLRILVMVQRAAGIFVKSIEHR